MAHAKQSFRPQHPLRALDLGGAEIGVQILSGTRGTSQAAFLRNIGTALNADVRFVSQPQQPANTSLQKTCTR